MPLDAICLTAVKDELSRQITGMKIDKILQPERDVIILSLRGNGGQMCRLLISAGADDARIHLTEFKQDNPKQPPMFCMLLRKHLTGARIIKISQLPAERVLSLYMETSDSMGIRSEKQLIIEMIGRLSSVILTDNEGIIIDCLRRIGGELTGKRSVLPGLFYKNPPQQEGKINPLTVTDTELFSRIKDAVSNKRGITIEKWLISTFTAFSPLICREIAWRAYGDTDYHFDAVNDGGEALKNTFLSLIRQVNSGSFEPWMIYTENNKLQDFSYIHIRQYESICKSKREDSFSCLLDKFFTKSAQEKRNNQRSASSLKTMTTARNRLARKMDAQRSELEVTSKRDYLRECGDLITANMHHMKKGQQSLIADDFYSENEKTREIKLDVLKTPQQNAAKYYKAYTKAKNARITLAQQIETGEKELVYIESVIEQLQRAENESDLNEIRNELLSTGYIRKKREKQHQKGTGKKKKTKRDEFSYHQFKSTGGMRILAGRNNIQNDRLTLKTSAKTDIWFHAQKIHGAHVVVSCAGINPDDETLNQAASIAAFYSAARSGGKVPVDYTLVKNVKKPSGGRPGMVIYSDYKTILAVPDEELVNKLRDDW